MNTDLQMGKEFFYRRFSLKAFLTDEKRQYRIVKFTLYHYNNCNTFTHEKQFFYSMFLDKVTKFISQTMISVITSNVPVT